MGEFKQGFVRTKDNKGIYFGNDLDASIIYDAANDALVFSATTFSGLPTTSSGLMSIHGDEYHNVDYALYSELTTLSGVLQNEINNIDLSDYATIDYVDTVSGSLEAHFMEEDNYYYQYTAEHYSLLTHAHSGIYQPVGDYATNSKVDTASGTLQSQIDNLDLDYATDADLVSVSGALQYNIDNLETMEVHDNTWHSEVYATVSGLTAVSGSLQDQIDNLTPDHASLTNLDYASSGHTGFQPAGDYATTSQLITTSGVIVSQIPTDYITEAELTTASGNIVAQIPSLSGYATTIYVDTVSGALNTSKANAIHTHDDRYYTETEVDTISGALNTKISNIDLTPYVKTDGSRNITGQQTFTNNVVIQGNLVVSGTQVITEVEDVLIEDHLLTLNYGETASGISFPYAGIEIERGTAINYLFVFDETEDNFQVGVSGSLQPVATREASPLSSGIALWNASLYRFDTIPSTSYSASTHLHDDRYYTETEVDTISGSIVAQIPSPITDYITEAEMTTISGDITAQIPTDYATDGELAAVSGSLQDQIDNFSGMEQHGDEWHNVDYATVSGLTAVSGSLQNQIDQISPSMAFTDLTDVPTSYAGQAGLAVVVNGTSDGLIFTTISGEIGPQGPPGVSGTNGVDGADGADGEVSYAYLDTVSGVLQTQITSLATLNPSLSTDHAYSSTAVATGTAGEALTFGQVCYFKNDGKYWKSCATASGSGMPVRAMALESISADASGNFLVGQGYVRDDSWTWTTAGDIYASTTSGTMTQTVPDTAGNVVQILGYATASGTIFFSPDSTYIVRA